MASSPGVINSPESSCEIQKNHDSEEARCEAQRECREMALKYTILR